jgi:hypothetical protein
MDLGGGCPARAVLGKEVAGYDHINQLKLWLMMPQSNSKLLSNRPHSRQLASRLLAEFLN